MNKVLENAIFSIEWSRVPLKLSAEQMKQMSVVKVMTVFHNLDENMHVQMNTEHPSVAVTSFRKKLSLILMAIEEKLRALQGILVPK